VTELARPARPTRFTALEDAARAGDTERARVVAAAIRREFVPVHDGFVDASAAALSHFVDVTSPEEGEAIGREAMQRHMRGPWFDRYIGSHDQSPEELRSRIRSIVTTWHWHPSEITVVEDDVRVTVETHPCGSGMRLELRGRYDVPGGWHRSVRGSASTFMEAGFPMYCNHCPEMNRAGLSRGATTWLVEGWRPHRAPERQACRQHSYKRLADVPTEFYTRVGLEPPAAPAALDTGPSPRLFSDEALADLAVHPCDRVVRLLEAGDAEGARGAAIAAHEGWAGMHDAYPIWLAVLWEEAERRLGRSAQAELLERTTPELVASVRDAAPEDWEAFWSMHLRLHDVRESRDGWTFVVGSDAFVDAEHCGVSVEQFVRALDRGVRRRGWTAVGRFAAEGELLLHHLAGEVGG
jgi:hypothetical protein